MSMLSDIKAPCPNCSNLIEQKTLVPEPNFSADKMKDSGVEFEDQVICEHCGYELSIWGSNTYYELYIASDDIPEDDFYYSQPEYDFEEYESDDSTEESGVSGVIDNRGITALYHFSKIENLSAITNQGIIPRAKLKAGSFKYTDINRADGFLDANCISVSFPQYRMFFIKRVKQPEQNWVVFEVSPELLNSIDAAFFERNAAARTVKSTVLENRKSATAFEKMFDEIEGLPSRSDTKLPVNYPTDPQAEILVFDEIEKGFIVAAHFQNKEIEEKYKHELNGIKSMVTPELFENRVDHDAL